MPHARSLADWLKPSTTTAVGGWLRAAAAVITVICCLYDIPIHGQAVAPARVQDDDLLPHGRKRALVVGNNAYDVAPLRNAVNDARALHAVLRTLGFDADLLLDVPLRELAVTVDRFTSSIRPGDTAVVYFAGHGIQIAGENYLLPIDFHATTESEAKRQADPASRAADRLAGSGAELVLLVLDACSDNPFRRGSGERNSRSLASQPGLASMPPYKIVTGPAVRTSAGMLIQFASGSGDTADDNPRGANGLFASHLLGVLTEPGLSVEDIFSRVRQRVNDDSHGRQVPLTISSIVRPMRLVPSLPTVPPDVAFWNLVKNTTSADLIDLYLTLFPNGAQVAEARLRSSELHAIEEAAELAKADDTVFGLVRDVPTRKNILSYINRFPSGRHREEADRLLESAQEENALELPPPIDAVLRRYAAAYEQFDVRLLLATFPSAPARLKAAFRDLPKACRAYRVSFASASYYKKSNDTALVEATSTYTCLPLTNQAPQSAPMTDLFRLRRGANEVWSIESIGSFDDQRDGKLR